MRITSSIARLDPDEVARVQLDVTADSEHAGRRVRIVPTGTPYPLHYLPNVPRPYPTSFARDELSELVEAELGRPAALLDAQGGASFELELPAGLLAGARTRTLGFAARLEAADGALFSAPYWILLDP